MRILTEASGSLTAAYLIKAIHDAGYEAVASDINKNVAAVSLADDFIVVPAANSPSLWQRMHELLREHKIDVVVPSLDETLAGWARRRDEFLSDSGCHVIVSAAQSVEICQDKWKTFQFFSAHGIPCPETSLAQDYALVKPRFGRGGVGVCVPEGPVNMDEMISQELLEGDEYTIDVFCDDSATPVYIVPRRRMNVRDGKSTAGIVELHKGIEDWVRRICAAIEFRGPVNLQCFVSGSGEIRFVEINPRIAGGMALGMAATENWMALAVRHFLEREPIIPVPVKNGLRMMRYYAEVFVS